MTTVEPTSTLHAGSTREGQLVFETHQALTEEILRGMHPPGTPLRDSQIATRRGLSRAPVREALRLLHQEGLVTKRPNHSYRVSVFDREDALQLAAIRVALESTAIRVLVTRQHDLSPAHQALDLVRSAEITGAPMEIALSDLTFHKALVACTGLPHLITAHRPIADQTALAVHGEIMAGTWTATRGSFEQHRHLLEQILEAQRTGHVRRVIAHLEQKHILGGDAIDLIGRTP